MRVRAARRLFSFCCSAIAIVFVASAHAGSPAGAAPSPEAPLAVTADALWASSFKDLSGGVRTFESLKGKLTIVYFWATWCAPCAKEAPHLRDLHVKYKDRGFEVLGIAVDNADKVKAFVEKYELTFPIVYGGREAIQLSRDLGNSLGGIPFLVIVGRDGKIIERITGETKDGRLEGVLDPLLAG